ncbi:MAG: DUF6894 family protein [Janthinobacterium lividum]
MKRYFFNFFDGTQWSYDMVGQNFDSLQEMRKEARHALVQLSENYCLVENECTLMFDVLDEEDQSICKIRLSLSEETLIRVD